MNESTVSKNLYALLLSYSSHSTKLVLVSLVRKNTIANLQFFSFFFNIAPKVISSPVLCSLHKNGFYYLLLLYRFV